MKKFLISVISGFLLLVSNISFADEFSEELSAIQQAWAVANYEQEGKAQVEAFDELLSNAESFQNNYAVSAEAWVWKGIVESSYAGAKGGLGALSLAKSAKASFEQALKINASALAGSAYTSLGTLYHKVPGWPIGFGSDKKAKEMLTKALEINPDGIDANYFYGEFLFDDGKYEEAEKYLLAAKAADPRPMRPLADKYRHQEIEALLTKLKKKLKK